MRLRRRRRPVVWVLPGGGAIGAAQVGQARALLQAGYTSSTA